MKVYIILRKPEKIWGGGGGGGEKRLKTSTAFDSIVNIYPRA